MSLSALTAVSPLDGRYHQKTAALSGYFSEYGLMRRRVLVEIEWFKLLARNDAIAEIPALSPKADDFLDRLAVDFSEEDAGRIKVIEKTTNHDVKAVEYFLREKVKNFPEIYDISEFFHFACTSEDINSVAWGLALREFREAALLPQLRSLRDALKARALEHAAVPMLARTHGQPASPTTVGKELANFCYRLHLQIERIASVPIAAKMNGAVGNYNAHHVACPGLDWPELTGAWLLSLGLTPNPYTTQIEPHDRLAELLDATAGAARVMTDLCRDAWGYIALGIFVQKAVDGEVGSSTMPHKVNPIDFENAEGNLGIAAAMARHLSEKLPVSRWQRDLSDSTVMRSLGSVFGHFMIAVDSVQKGLGKIGIDHARAADELAAHPEIVSEAVQTLLRKHRVGGAYEKLKALVRGRTVTPDDLAACIRELGLPDETRNFLLGLEPAAYTGLAENLARRLKTCLE